LQMCQDSVVSSAKSVKTAAVVFTDFEDPTE
jgi:hypothetical protein